MWASPRHHCHAGVGLAKEDATKEYATRFRIPACLENLKSCHQKLSTDIHGANKTERPISSNHLCT